MADEAMDILEMVRDGRLTAEQGAELLAALHSRPAAAAGGQSGRPRFIRVRVEVADQKGKQVNVNSNLPIALADLALKLAEGAKITRDGETIVLGDYVKQLGGVDISSILQLVREGAEGKLVDVDVTDGDAKVKVEVTVD
jgi:hypothetical protein